MLLFIAIVSFIAGGVLTAMLLDLVSEFRPSKPKLDSDLPFAEPERSIGFGAILAQQREKQ